MELDPIVTMLVRCRTGAGLTKAEIARRITAGGHKVSQSYVAHVEAGSSPPTEALVEGYIAACRPTRDGAELLRALLDGARSNRYGRRLAERALGSIEQMGAIRLHFAPLVSGAVGRAALLGGGPLAKGRVAVPESLALEFEGLFAVRVEDDSMSPRWTKGDVIVCSLGRRPGLGLPAVAAAGGRIILGVVTRLEPLELSPVNPNWPRWSGALGEDGWCFEAVWRQGAP